MMLGELRPITKERPTDGLFGRLYRFDQIDPKAQWFNVSSHAAASKEEVSQIKIPDALKPNLIMFNFVFYPKNHQMYFETKADGSSLGPLSAQRFIEKLVADQRISKNFPNVEITVVPEKNQLKKVLSIPEMRKLVIDLKRPNPDGFSEATIKEVYRRLDAIGAKRQTEEFVAARTDTLKPDEGIKSLAYVAAHNGKVYSVGRNAEGEKVTESTTDKPHYQAIRYDPSVATREDELIAQTKQ